jgi:hypothetical protein
MIRKRALFIATAFDDAKYSFSDKTDEVIYSSYNNQSEKQRVSSGVGAAQPWCIKMKKIHKIHPEM